MRLISDFKETVLLQIYDYSSKYLLDIISKEVKIENNETIFICEIAKCLISSFEFDEISLNDKSDKYFIV